MAAKAAEGVRGQTHKYVGMKKEVRKISCDSGYDSLPSQREEEMLDEAIIKKINIESDGKVNQGLTFIPPYDQLVLQLKPYGKVKQKLELSPTIHLEIPPSAVDTEVRVTAKIVDTPQHPLCLGNYEFLLTDIFELGVEPYGENFRFKEPVTFRMEVNDPEALDKNRDIVVRTADKSGKWTDLQTKLSTDDSGVVEITTKMDHFSKYTVVSKIRTFDVYGDHEVHFSITDREVTQGNANVPKVGKPVRLSVEVVNIEKKLVQRARETTKDCQANLNIAFDTVVHITKSTETSPNIVVTMKVPTGEDNPDLEVLKAEGRLMILQDNDNDDWGDISDSIEKTNSSKQTITFKAKTYEKGGSRYVIVITNIRTEPKEIVNTATRMARHGLTLVQFLLLQNKERPTTLIVDCLEEEKVQERCDKLLANGFAPPLGYLHFTNEVDVAEGEKIKVQVGGENIHCLNDHIYDITFYSRRTYNQKQLTVGLRDNLPQQPKNEYKGVVDFVRTQNPYSRDDARLFFAIPGVSKSIAKVEKRQNDDKSTSAPPKPDPKQKEPWKVVW